jgi:5,10-methylenetetrahydrofolate reductase
VASGLRPLPAWKREADFLFAQVSFSVHDLLEWRSTVEFDGPVFAGVMVIPSASMARKLSTDLPELTVPDRIIRRLDRDHDAGLEIALDLVREIQASGAFEGVHLIPVTRYRDVALRLEQLSQEEPGRL